MSLLKKDNATQANATAEEQKAIKKRQRKRRVKRIFKIAVILFILVAVAFYAFTRFFGNRRSGPAEVTYIHAQVQRRNITEELSGSGTLESAASYTLTTRVGGEILSDTFAEGDTVKEGDVLYALDSSDMDASLERAKKSLQKAEETYAEKLADREKLRMTAPINGVISGLNIEAGDSVKAGAAVLTIKDITVLTLTEYYSVAFKEDIYVGMPATVSVPGQMLNLAGKVSAVSALTRYSETGVQCFAVTVQVENPGSLLIGTTATAWVGGDIYPTITSTDGLKASATKVVYADVSGEVSKLDVANGDIVRSGMELMVLSGDTLEDEIEKAKDSVEDAQLSLDNLNETLKNYTVTAPIDGTVIRKVKKAGESASNGDTLVMIYDLSYLTVTLAIDELDIKTVEVGQRATVTADAVEGAVFEGIVTRVGVNGTTSGGVTTYPVDIRIDETDGLLPGMNADIVITVEEVTDVLTIPIDAVERNNRVLVKTPDGSTGEGAPDGYKYVTVEIGMSDEDYVEIRSGLSEGDTVSYISRTITTTGGNMQMGGFGMMGGMPSGGMPSGGMPSGGMPSGGMSGGSSRPSGDMSGGSSSRPSGGMSGGSGRPGGGF